MEDDAARATTLASVDAQSSVTAQPYTLPKQTSLRVRLLPLERLVSCSGIGAALHYSGDNVGGDGDGASILLSTRSMPTDRRQAFFTTYPASSSDTAAIMLAVPPPPGANASRGWLLSVDVFASSSFSLQLAHAMAYPGQHWRLFTVSLDEGGVRIPLATLVTMVTPDVRHLTKQQQKYGSIKTCHTGWRHVYCVVAVGPLQHLPPPNQHREQRAQCGRVCVRLGCRVGCHASCAALHGGHVGGGGGVV